MTGKAGKAFSLIENKFTYRCCSSAWGSWRRQAVTSISNFRCSELTNTGTVLGRAEYDTHALNTIPVSTYLIVAALWLTCYQPQLNV